MASLEQEIKQRQDLKTVLEALKEIDPESLVRTEVLGKELSFEKGLPVFRRTLSLFKDLSECNLDSAPYETLHMLTNLAQEALSNFGQIRGFSVQQHSQNPAQVRDSLIAQINERWNQYYMNITPHISYAIRRGTDFDALEREARGTLSLVKQTAIDLQTEKDKILADMQGALEKVRQAAAEAGVAQHAIHFKQEADSHQKEGFRWLALAALFAVGTIGYAIYSLGVQLHDIALTAPTSVLIQLSLSRLIVISILYYGVVFCARHYGGSRHNFVINRHRQNALSTFETFVKAASDAPTKDAVLVKATQAIFMPQSTGYSKGQSEPQPASPIIEIMRGVAGTKG